MRVFVFILLVCGLSACDTFVENINTHLLEQPANTISSMFAGDPHNAISEPAPVAVPATIPIAPRENSERYYGNTAPLPATKAYGGHRVVPLNDLSPSGWNDISQ